MIPKYSCIIVDDEPHARFRLRQILEQTDKFDILTEAKDGIEGIELINRLQPEVVFLDIEMPGLDGFAMLERISHDPFVIFCTAYDHYALKAFETFSVDYLLKPIELPRLIKTIEKLHRLSEQSSVINLMRKELQKTSIPQKSNIIPVKIGDRIILISLDKVTHFEASEKSVYLYDSAGKKYLTDHSLQSLETKLPDHFIRVSRATIVNEHFISECRKYFKGNHILVLNNPDKTKIATGSAYNERIKRLLEY